MIVRRRLALLALAGFLIAPRASGATPAAAITEPIAALDQSLIAAMKAGRQTPFAVRYSALAPAVERAMNMTEILKGSVGPRWQDFAQPQQATLLSVFTQFTIASYVANFDLYEGERFEIMPDLRSYGSDEIVSTRIVPASGAPTRLDYVMRDGPAGWQAVDVLINGSISRVAVQRSDFRTLLASGGADRLIASLQQKIAELSGGALR